MKNKTREVSKYGRVFDDTNKNWSKDAEYNELFLRRMQAYANDVLKTKGFIFLNDVYDMLEMYKSVAGQKVGWHVNSPKGFSDGYVSFGIERLDGGPNFQLDFNVDGEILKLLPEW